MSEKFKSTRHCKVVSFGGKFGFWARTKFPMLGSNMYLSLLRLTNQRFIKEYIDHAIKQDQIPLWHIDLETFNKCNGTCSFCPNNRNLDKRIPHLMDEDMYRKIIDDLAAASYHGALSLMGNAEPFLDPHIADRICYAREKLPRAQLLLFSNGTVVTEEKLAQIAGKLDFLYINNYAPEYKLNDSSIRIYNYVTSHEDDFGDMIVQIEYRYSEEILTNRAGKAPNKLNDKTVIHSRCLLPYVDTYILSDGSVSLCCCETTQVHNFGNVKDQTIFEIFNSDQMKQIREKMKDGRDGYAFCKYCDFESKGNRRRDWMQDM